MGDDTVPDVVEVADSTPVSEIQAADAIVADEVQKEISKEAPVSGTVRCDHC